MESFLSALVLLLLLLFWYLFCLAMLRFEELPDFAIALEVEEDEVTLLDEEDGRDGEEVDGFPPSRLECSC